MVRGNGIVNSEDNRRKPGGQQADIQQKPGGQQGGNLADNRRTTGGHLAAIIPGGHPAEIKNN